MQIIHHRDDLAVFHPGRPQHRHGPYDLSVQSVSGLHHAAVLDAGELVLAADGHLQTGIIPGVQNILHHFFLFQDTQQVFHPAHILEFRLVQQLLGAAKEHFLLAVLRDDVADGFLQGSQHHFILGYGGVHFLEQIAGNFREPSAFQQITHLAGQVIHFGAAHPRRDIDQPVIHGSVIRNDAHNRLGIAQG